MLVCAYMHHRKKENYPYRDLTLIIYGWRVGRNVYYSNTGWITYLEQIALLVSLIFTALS